MKRFKINKHTQKKMKKEKTDSKAKEKSVVETKCNDKNCHIHGNLKTRGRTFKGAVIKKFHKRVVIEFERLVYVKKYERYKKLKTKIHARLPGCMEEKINVGDYINIQECRPLSKLVHFAVIGKIKSKEEIKK